VNPTSVIVLSVLLAAVARGPACLAAPTEAGERERLATQRRAIDTAYESRAAECRSRFVVTPCIDAAREQRRAALAPVRDRELQLDAAERERRAEERRRSVAAKQQAAAMRPPVAEPLAVGAGAASAARSVREPMLSRAVPAPGVEVHSRDGSARSEVRVQEAAQRAERRREREAAGQGRRDRVAERQMERSLRGKSSEPLPPPPTPASANRR
jgi:hypothetical protein